MAANVLQDRVDLQGAKMVDPAQGLRFRRKCNPEPSDVLVVSRGATIGRSCIVAIETEFCLMGSVILIKPRKDKIDARFLSTFLKHPAARRSLGKASGSSAQQAIY